MATDELVIGDELAIPLEELSFRFSRASGPGGQHVNRTASRVELLYDVGGSPSLTESQRQRLLTGLERYIDRSGVLHLVSQNTPSQWRNRQEALGRFQRLLQQALKPRRHRVATRPSRHARERRLQDKRRRGQTKELRRKPSLDD
ncbi:MAG: alternative ribosome rescue aminoacyl-tRNA hydrolase ArfB [Anaerolineae bacterium]